MERLVAGGRRVGGAGVNYCGLNEGSVECTRSEGGKEGVAPRCLGRNDLGGE